MNSAYIDRVDTAIRLYSNAIAIVTKIYVVLFRRHA